MNVHKDILDTIGNTPMIELTSVNPNPNVRIYAKFEGTNPTGSIKDRIALKMIEQAEAEGTLVKGKTIIEPTSGNTGIGLAMIGAKKGYDVEVVMSSAVSVERRKMIAAFGAKVILTDASKGTDGAILKVRELVAANPERYFNPDQFSNKYNKLAHYQTTAKEIWEQAGGDREKGGRGIDYFVSAIGTSGTIMGVGMGLKEFDSNIKIVCAEPVKGHYIQGLKNMGEALVPSIYNPDEINETVMIDNDEAFDMARRIIKEEGIFVGMSSGAAVYAAVEVAKRIDSGVITVILADRGEKYLSTKLFEGIDDGTSVSGESKEAEK